MTFFKKLLNTYQKIEDVLMVAIISCVTIIIFIATIGRYTGWITLSWSEEFARYAIIWMVYIGAGYSGRKNQHFNVSTLVDACPWWFQMIAYVLQILLMTACTYFTVVYGAKLILSTQKLGQHSPMLRVQTWTLYLTLPIGSILCYIGYVINRIEEIRISLGNRKKADTAERGNE